MKILKVKNSLWIYLLSSRVRFSDSLSVWHSCVYYHFSNIVASDEMQWCDQKIRLSENSMRKFFQLSQNFLLNQKIWYSLERVVIILYLMGSLSDTYVRLFFSNSRAETHDSRKMKKPSNIYLIKEEFDLQNIESEAPIQNEGYARKCKRKIVFFTWNVYTCNRKNICNSKLCYFLLAHSPDTDSTKFSH